MLVERDEITSSPEAALRATASSERIATLDSRFKRGASFLPLILHRSADGKLVLVDGWNRLAVFAQNGVNLIAAAVVEEDLATALVAGLRANAPKEGKLRVGTDAQRGLMLLATALGRKITPAEAQSIGLTHAEHNPQPPEVIAGFGCPEMPSGPKSKSPGGGGPHHHPKKKAA